MFQRIALILALVNPLFTKTPVVVVVYPSGSVVSEHALRISIVFDSAQDREVLSRLSLRNQEGSLIPKAFLKQELWSPDRKELTILFDPGRLKTGLGRQTELGVPLVGQEKVTLELDGQSLKTWDVKRGGCRPVSLADWQIIAPKSESISSLIVKFPEPIDSQARHLIAVIDSHDSRVDGEQTLTNAEQEWRFSPSHPWRRGAYRILAHPDLENPCGDQVGESFEHSAQPRPTPERSRVFRVSP